MTIRASPAIKRISVVLILSGFEIRRPPILPSSTVSTTLSTATKVPSSEGITILHENGSPKADTVPPSSLILELVQLYIHYFHDRAHSLFHQPTL